MELFSIRIQRTFQLVSTPKELLIWLDGYHAGIQKGGKK